MSWASFEVQTGRRAQLVNITERVGETVEKSGVKDGVCHVYVPHTTAGVTVNEGADPDVAADIESRLAELVPKEAAFEHAEGNSDSHIKTVLVGPSCAVPVRAGKLAMGTWQAIFLCEWDGPRTRQVEVAVTPL
ncbi:MAG TPA: secondary thiamine-phosphate synthase enzyme YjbQ [Candidatus Dormibacteraeota bacterium]|nr:secondary thiamine-phosphate synthase enzyme YjbQ [Candidatus Dormibacteraeota bacterium]